MGRIIVLLVYLLSIDQGAPVQVQLYWINASSARLSWVQTSTATEVWLSKEYAGKHISMAMLPGENSRYFSIDIPGNECCNDEAYRPHSGERYTIVECKRRLDRHIEWCAEYGQYPLGERLKTTYIPLVRS
jgi:hypothetical protein